MFRFNILAAVLVGLTSTACLADELAVKGREIFQAQKSAIVTVELVVKQKISFPGMGTQEDESITESTGTVISPDGLTIVSLSETDPSALIENMMAGMAGMDNMKIESEIRDVKILLEGGDEIPAEIILRDKEMDMAFVRPLEKPERPMAHVDLSNPGKPDYLENVVTINRLGKVAKRTHAVSFERIQAIVEKPRTFYIPGNNPTQTGLGSPAFTMDGKLIGVFLLRSIKATGGGGLGGMFGGMQDNVATVIIPVEDIQEAASQAPPYK